MNPHSFIEVRVVNPMLNELPRYATPGSAGLDLRACCKERVVLYPDAPAVLVGTGIAINIMSPGHMAVLAPRSGLGHKRGLVLGNTLGFIDSDYQGEVMLSMWNRSQDTIQVDPLDVVAQMFIVPVVQIGWMLVDQFTTVTQRGEGGFGSTG